MPSLFATVVAVLAATTAAMPGNPEQRAVCNADNCLRAVRASSLGTAPLSECNSFFRTTIVPCFTATSTSTLFFTVTATPRTFTPSISTAKPVTATPTPVSPVSTVSGAQDIQERQGGATCQSFEIITADAVPARASACSGTARFSSACSCVGATHTQVTSFHSTTITIVRTLTLTPVVTATPSS